MEKAVLALLPLEVWLQIASTSPEVWWRLCLVIKSLGMYSLDKNVQCRIHHYFDIPNVINDDGWDTIMHKWLDGNGNLHRDDDKPAIRIYRLDLTREFADYLYCEEWYRNGKSYRDDDKPNIHYYYHEDSISVWWKAFYPNLSTSWRPRQKSVTRVV